VPHLAPEVVLHGDPLLVVRTSGTAPEGGAAWTVLTRGRRRRDEDVVDLLAGAGIDVRRQVVVRLDRSPAEQVHDLGGSPYGVRWQGPRTVRRKLAPPPYDGLHLAGASAAAAASLPLVGLASAVVAQRIGPA
jgi:UDP-galactopyranose mutase